MKTKTLTIALVIGLAAIAANAQCSDQTINWIETSNCGDQTVTWSGRIFEYLAPSFCAGTRVLKVEWREWSVELSRILCVETKVCNDARHEDMTVREQMLHIGLGSQIPHYLCDDAADSVACRWQHREIEHCLWHRGYPPEEAAAVIIARRMENKRMGGIASE
jgi:Tfp pilus assembly protein PilV